MGISHHCQWVNNVYMVSFYILHNNDLLYHPRPYWFWLSILPLLMFILMWLMRYGLVGGNDMSYPYLLTCSTTMPYGVRSWRCGCLVPWFCYQLKAKPGNKTAAPSWPDPYVVEGQTWYCSGKCGYINSCVYVTKQGVPNSSQVQTF